MFCQLLFVRYKSWNKEQLFQTVKRKKAKSIKNVLLMCNTKINKLLLQLLKQISMQKQYIFHITLTFCKHWSKEYPPPHLLKKTKKKTPYLFLECFYKLNQSSTILFHIHKTNKSQSAVMHAASKSGLKRMSTMNINWCKHFPCCDILSSSLRPCTHYGL